MSPMAPRRTTSRRKLDCVCKVQFSHSGGTSLASAQPVCVIRQAQSKPADGEPRQMRKPWREPGREGQNREVKNKIKEPLEINAVLRKKIAIHFRWKMCRSESDYNRVTRSIHVLFSRNHQCLQETFASAPSMVKSTNLLVFCTCIHRFSGRNVSFN
jgi:hypothetical protein